MDEELRSPHGCSTGDGGYACDCNRIDVTQSRVSERRFRAPVQQPAACPGSHPYTVIPRNLRSAGHKSAIGGRFSGSLLFLTTNKPAREKPVLIK